MRLSLAYTTKEREKSNNSPPSSPKKKAALLHQHALACCMLHGVARHCTALIGVNLSSVYRPKEGSGQQTPPSERESKIAPPFFFVKSAQSVFVLLTGHDTGSSLYAGYSQEVRVNYIVALLLLFFSGKNNRRRFYQEPAWLCLLPVCVSWAINYFEIKLTIMRFVVTFGRTCL